MTQGIMAATLDRSPHPCAYCPGHLADFEHYWVFQVDDESFCQLLEAGFRRFGSYFFRPACPGEQGGAWCGTCLPLRVPVAEFQPSKSQRRVMRRGSDITFSIQRPDYSEQKYEIYVGHKKRFGKSASGEDAEDNEPESPEAFRQSFYQPNPFTWECCYYVGDRLIGVGLIDVASRLLSSIYFFFDPEFDALSPGTLSVLCEINLAREHGIPFYYLGYTVYDCRAMRYKAEFRPCEIHDGRRWRLFRDDQGRFTVDWPGLRTEPFAPLFTPALQPVVE